MKVILLEDVKSLGKKGEIVNVSDGYGRNMILPKKLDLSYTLISVLGSLGHNFGQLLMASVIMKSGFVIYYLPIMAVSGVGMGVATGFLLRVMLPYMNTLQLVKH